MKKILLISDSFLNNSGCAVIARNTYEIFKQKGWPVEVFTSYGYFNDNNYKYKKYFPELLDSPKKYLKNIFNYYYNLNSSQNLNKLIDEMKPEIAHIHCLRSSSITYSILKVLHKNNIPIVMTLHDASLICPMMTLIKGSGEFCHNFSCKGLNKLPCLLNKCAPNGIEQGLRRAMFSFVSDLSNNIKYISKFITPSNALKDLVLNANIGIKDNNIIVINNFLPNEELNTIPNYSNSGYFLYIGRLSKEKGVHYLLEAMKDLPREIKLKIVGTGIEETSLKQYTKENNLNNVEFVGFKHREEIKEYYQNCIATILPCNWFENFPTTNMESFINGKPVIASNIGGIPEQIEHNKTGLLFEPANIEQLKECILTYWNNSNLVIEHGKIAYQKAKVIYTPEEYYHSLKKMYKEVVN